MLADRLHDTYRAAGFAVDPTTEEAEHLATELRALAHLSAAESDAIEDGLGDIVEHLRALSLRVLEGHLLRWFPTLAAAARSAGRAWPSALVDQVEDLLFMHRRMLGERTHDGDAFSLPELPAMLDADETGLRDLARMLTLPALSGMFLSRDDVARVGRTSRVPRGFGERRVLLENLFRSAVELGSFGEVIGNLIDLFRERDRALEAASATGVPGLATLVEPLRRRIATTIAMLERLEGEARQLPAH